MIFGLFILCYNMYTRVESLASVQKILPHLSISSGFALNLKIRILGFLDFEQAVFQKLFGHRFSLTLEHECIFIY